MVQSSMGILAVNNMSYRSFGTSYPTLELRLHTHSKSINININTNVTEYPSVAIAYLGSHKKIAVYDSEDFMNCFEIARLEYDVMRICAFRKRLDASIELNLTMKEVIVLERRAMNKVRYRLKNKSREKLYCKYD
jgi:hypothetical protein